jgi:hypothetical protein
MASQRWRVAVRRAGRRGTPRDPETAWGPHRWEKGWLELTAAGPIVQVAGQPLSPVEVEAVYARSVLARLVLLRHGWPLVSRIERHREEADHATA